MNGEVDNGEKGTDVVEDIETAVEPEDTVVLDDVGDIDNVGDISVEINVEELVAKIEAGDDDGTRNKLEVRRQLDELEDERKAEKELDSTYNFNLDDDL